MCQPNKPRAVRIGIVPLLLELLIDECLGIVDETLAILVMLGTHQDGQNAIGHQSAIHILVMLICSATAHK